MQSFHARLAPVGDTERIDALDLIRGIALLGILFVNIQVFGETFGTYTRPAPEPEQGILGAISYYWVSLFCESRFYTVFSMLFGVGLAIQWSRAQRQGRSYLGYGLRRLLTLMVIGLLHGLLIWFGDILFLYSIVGLATLPFLRARPSTLLAVAVSILVVATFLGSAFFMMKPINPPAADAATLALVDPNLPPFERLMKGFEVQAITSGPEDPLWISAETEALRDGPFLQATLFRGLGVLMMLVFSVAGMGWGIWSMFLIGVALLKLNFFARDRGAWHRRSAIIGIAVGFPMVLASDVLMAGEVSRLNLFLSAFIHGLGAPIMALGYLGLFTLFAYSHAWPRIKETVARVGRMGLTNYLLESVLATFVFYHWGLGQFGQTTRIERMGVVLVIYLILAAFSTLWLRHFRFGPMEWLWRTMTYLRPQPMTRANPGMPVAD